LHSSQRSDQPERVVVFIDYENAQRGALDALSPAVTAGSHGHFNPRELGELLVGRRNAAGHTCELTEVRIYRGQPAPRRQPAAAAANSRQAIVWERLGKLTVIRRPLRYPRSWPAEPAVEKGIDVRLAVDVVRLAYENVYDVGIVFSADTDLLPAIEAVIDHGGPHLEVASWADSTRLRIPGLKLWCHWLDACDYQTIADLTHYSGRRHN
jgi:uncharacterized LabA/DUF88 family protein